MRDETRFLHEYNRTEGKLNALVLYYSTTDDICLLRMLDGGAQFVSPIAASLDVFQGKQVFVLGYPQVGSALTMAEGIVSQADPVHQRFRILSDASTAHGGSGGPVCGKNGAYIGIALEVDGQTGNYVSVLPYWKLMPLLV